jgi:hypothetical protein
MIFTAAEGFRYFAKISLESIFLPPYFSFFSLFLHYTKDSHTLQTKKPGNYRPVLVDSAFDGLLFTLATAL